ncbi:MAG: Protease HtpX [Parcubacteria group bacterium Licking1014_17]|nr:MAG: Protease HtpX [Parcubacteria group bacterium Licking1014_17]
MENLYTYKDSNIRKSILYLFFFAVLVIAVGWIFSRAYNNPLILYIAVAFSIFGNFLSYWYSDKIALALSGAHPASHEENTDLYHLVENLSITAGLPMPKVYIIDSPQINAFATGRNPEHSALAVTTGALQRLTKTELEGVIAHEMSHIGNRDILIASIAVVLAGFIAIISDFFIRSRWGFFGKSSDRNGKGNIFGIIAIVAAILAPIAATLIRLAVSRQREYLADTTGALLTRYPEGLASALQKISEDDYQMTQARTNTAHLFIANPFKGKSLANLFSTHPPIEERIKRLRDLRV